MKTIPILPLFFLSFIGISSMASPTSQCDVYRHSTDRMPQNNYNKTLGWCYAFASADIISDYLDVKVSPYDVAAKYYNSELFRERGLRRSHPSGGDVIIATISSKNKILCKEADTNFYNSDWEKQSEELQKFVRYNPYPGNACQKADFIVGFLGDMKKILGHLKPEVSLDMLHRITCRKTGVVFSSEQLMGFGKTPDYYYGLEHQPFVVNPIEVTENIEKAFAAKKPIAITFDVSMLIRETGLHAATLIGQRLNEKTKQCELIIRNNWGPRCREDLSEGVSCEEGTGEYYVDKNRAVKMIESGLWIQK